MKTFPVLYKKSNGGAIQCWKVECIDNVIQVTHGQLGGKLQTTTDVIKEGKNTGKTNATTPKQQAEAEAQSKWVKQTKKGYVESLEDAESGLVDESVIEGGIFPMLAPSKIYPHFAKKLKWPVIVQPKLDGTRLIAELKDGVCTLWSRTRKRVNSLPHIEKLVCERFGQFGDAVYDGEAYNHEYAQANGFEGLVSLIRSDTPAEGHEVIQYWIYDLPDSKLPQAERDKLRLERLKTNGDTDGVIQAVPSITCHSHEDVMKAFEKYLELGFEGAMVRSNDGLYECGKRSYNLQKLKSFVDDEVKILRAEEGRGKDVGTVGAFVCEAKNGKEFKARLKATYERRRELFEHPELWQGKKLTVTYQNLSFEGIPRFPVGKAIRDYE